MSLGARVCGDAIAASATGLGRAWRSARAAARAECSPGLLDGVIEPFYAVVGDALGAGRDPAHVWPETTGAVRVDPHDPRRTREELDAEWNVAEQVLLSACRALDASDGVREWIARAIVIARAGSGALPDRRGPPGILTVHVYAGTYSTRRGRRSAPR